MLRIGEQYRGSLHDVVRGGGRPLVYCDRGYGRVALEASLPA
jgi:hypothetical protein